jgi:hypothetical protein
MLGESRFLFHNVEAFRPARNGEQKQYSERLVTFGDRLLYESEDKAKPG